MSKYKNGLNAKTFNISLDDFEGETLEAVHKKKRLIGLKVLRGVVLKTPVDTGRARANWQLSINVPKTDVVNSKQKAGTKAITDGNRKLKLMKLGEDVYITNNLPYIGVLERGHSKQAPRGMVALTLAEIEATE
tara:strand:+ start:421 stop:822 length:402 start_codon:yes stop_codon:yes gene_type:complete